MTFAPRRASEGLHDAETADPLAEGGRGLLLINALADDRGIQTIAGGKQIWFRFQVERRPEDLRACSCADLTARGALLASGNRVVDMLAD